MLGCAEIFAQEGSDAATYYNKYSKLSPKEAYDAGMKCIADGKLNEAMTCFTITAGRYHDGMDPDEKRLCSYALNNAGALAMLRSDYSMAFSYFTKAMETADDTLSYQCYNNIAGIYIYFNDYDNARKYLDKAYEGGVMSHDWTSVYNTLHNMLDLDWDMDSLQNSTERIRKFRQLPISPKDKHYYFVAYICDGMESLNKQDPSAAIGYFEKAIGLAQGLPFVVNHVVPAYIYIAKAYMQIGDYQKALQYLKKSESESSQANAIDMLVKAYRYQEMCYAAAGDMQCARESKYRYMEIRDSINSANEYGKIKDMQFYHDLDSYEQQLSKLNNERHMRNLLIVSIGLGLLVALGFLAFTIYHNRSLKKSNKDLFDKNLALLHSEEQEQKLRKEYEQKIEQLRQGIGDTGRYKTSNLSDESREQLLGRIRDVMYNTDEICREDFTIEQLATAVGSNTKYVSQVINEMLGKNFNTLLNEQRINEVCKRLVDTEHYGSMTNEAIAIEVGFKSRSHFIRTFKKITGLTPSQYQKMAKDMSVGNQA